MLQRLHQFGPKPAQDSDRGRGEMQLIKLFPQNVKSEIFLCFISFKTRILCMITASIELNQVYLFLFIYDEKIIVIFHVKQG